jgi:hypothetical protein
MRVILHGADLKKKRKEGVFPTAEIYELEFHDRGSSPAAGLLDKAIYLISQPSWLLGATFGAYN